MSYQFTISDIGLRLIKAYEGFWPEARPLVSGGYVVGFGHRLEEGEDEVVTEEEAEELLKADLAPVEDLINSRVHASMTQSQFDALCSLVFSIGEEAFLASDMLHNLNRGMVIEASNGFDNWLKGNIGGQIYVVDALVRRRTAEKALFLRPTQRVARAPRFELASIRAHELVELPESREDKPQENMSEIQTDDLEPSDDKAESDIDVPLIVEAEPAAIVDTPEIEIPEDDPILISDDEEDKASKPVIPSPILLRDDVEDGTTGADTIETQLVAPSHFEGIQDTQDSGEDTTTPDILVIEDAKASEDVKADAALFENTESVENTDSGDDPVGHDDVKPGGDTDENGASDSDESTSLQALAAPLAPVIYSEEVIEEDDLSVTNLTPLTVVERIEIEDIQDEDIKQEEAAAPILTVVKNDPLEETDLGLPEDLIEASMEDGLEENKDEAAKVEEKLSIVIDEAEEKIEDITDEAEAFIAPKVGLETLLDADQADRNETGVAGQTENAEEEETSPIAAAAAEVSQRLDALIEDKPDETKSADASNVTMLNPKLNTKQDIIIDELQKDDALREQIARESQYNTNRYDDYVEVEDEGGHRGILAFGIMILVGLVSVIAGFVVNLQGSVKLLGENGPFIAVAAMLIGGLLVVVGLMYMMKAIFTRD